LLMSWEVIIINKQERIEAVKATIRKHKVENQEEFAKKFKEDHGKKIVQATISRTFKELKIKKGSDGYYDFEEEQRKKEEEIKLKAFLKEVSFRWLDSEFYILGTEKGHAATVGARLKKVYGEQIIGTIAQDDILLLMSDDSFDETLANLLPDEDVDEDVDGEDSP